jgi:diguanylate cyclase (GGDEF)-like protein/PAS domain S-box-containing protein
MNQSLPPSPSAVPVPFDPSAVASAPESGTVCQETEVSKMGRKVNALLQDLQDASDAIQETPAGRRESPTENRLASVRLGIATSLYYALRTKHPATASHGLRVALICSAWAEQMELDSDQRDRIEVAALLHDVGKIGIPDRILRKPGRLTVEEQLAMDTCAAAGCEILRGSTSDQELLEIIRLSSTWFESRREDDTPRGPELPFGARMLAIADAFDSMTTNQVYRDALSTDRAISQLVQGSGTQFDPQLVVDFSRLLEARPELLHGTVSNRWLHQLRPQESGVFWTGRLQSADRGRSHFRVRRETRFHAKLYNTLKDGVAFVDNEGRIDQWNVALERMTGLKSDAMIGKEWSSATIRLREHDDDQEERRCPVAECLHTQQRVRRAMAIEAPGDELISVHVEVALVKEPTGASLGAVIVIHDLSDRENLERRLENLHQETTRDPLTRVANRAHFDDTLTRFVKNASDGGKTFSLIICDLDHFKSINDTYGHPAGDEALKVFAELLRQHSRDGDLVARYGGEEFLLLTAECDNSAAGRRAEALREALESTRIDALDGQVVTASFGVTEFQSGDSPATVLARADRALLKAKDNGRNRVVQLGLGKMSEISEPEKRGGWLDWLTGGEGKRLRTIDIWTPVSIDLTIEKLRGFVADHQAEIINVAENQLSLKVMSMVTLGGRRRADQKVSFHVVVTLSQPQRDEMPSANVDPGCSTKVHLEIKPVRNRDRRRRELDAALQQVVSSFRCYLMGEVITGS